MVLELISRKARGWTVALTPPVTPTNLQVPSSVGERLPMLAATERPR
jgi:hypothetical protein